MTIFTFPDNRSVNEALRILDREDVEYYFTDDTRVLEVEDADDAWYAESLLYRAGINFNNHLS